MGTILEALSLSGFAYLLGSIPWGLIIARLFNIGDLLNSGSGNIGANNVRRVAGIGPGILTLVMDACKAGIPVYIARMFFASNETALPWVLSSVAFCAFLGHIYPIYMGFRNGGKGVATAAGGVAMISPGAVLAAIVMYVLFVFLSRRSSVGSMTAAMTLPVFIQVAEKSMVLTIFSIVMSILIVFRHQANIRRLIQGEEPPF
jgi:glycerol-3-phosphate acyltransferase PlsY